jgi:hypothetical protein
VRDHHERRRAEAVVRDVALGEPGGRVAQVIGPPRVLGDFPDPLRGRRVRLARPYQVEDPEIPCPRPFPCRSSPAPRPTASGDAMNGLVDGTSLRSTPPLCVALPQLRRGPTVASRRFLVPRAVTTTVSSASTPVSNQSRPLAVSETRCGLGHRGHRGAPPASTAAAGLPAARPEKFPFGFAAMVCSFRSSNARCACPSSINSDSIHSAGDIILGLSCALTAIKRPKCLTWRRRCTARGHSRGTSLIDHEGGGV